MSLIARSVALAVLIAPVSLMAQSERDQSDSSTTQSEAQAKPAKEKKVCRKVAKTGSRMGRRVSMTEAQWAALESGEVGAEIQIKSGGAMTGGAGGN